MNLDVATTTTKTTITTTTTTGNEISSNKLLTYMVTYYISGILHNDFIFIDTEVTTNIAPDITYSNTVATESQRNKLFKNIQNLMLLLYISKIMKDFFFLRFIFHK